MTPDNPIAHSVVPIITTLAEYQTRFWLEVGLQLKRQGVDCRFLSFDSRSNEMLTAAGLAFVDATASACALELGVRDPIEVCQSFGMDRLNFWLTHEKFAFGSRDTDALLKKIAGVLLVADRAIRTMADGVQPVMVQELGGFLSVIGSHFAAVHRGIPSLFIEPSFFRGRMLFLEGDVAARKLPDDMWLEPSGEVKDYLEDTIQRSAIVIPEKDRHQYTTAFRKVVNLRNAGRLVQKLVDKHVLGKQQEFGHIGSHVSSHARMIFDSRKLARHYTPVDRLGRFIYYPLHVPGDMALTLRSPQYLDQVALIDYLCRVAPIDQTIAVKEHPAMIGALGAEPLMRLKERYDRFHLIPPSTNNFEVIKAASAVVTVNSKSGAEAGLLGHKVIVLGDAFYRNAPFSTPLNSVTDLGRALEEVLAGHDSPPPMERNLGYFASLWEETEPGELYVSQGSNVATFTNSMLRAIECSGGKQLNAMAYEELSVSGN